MKKFPVLIAVSFLAVSALAGEQELLKVLSTEPGLEKRSAACAELKSLGTKASVPELARLLNDRNLSDSAREALEAIAGPEATEALVSALPITFGNMKAGIIGSLAARRDPRAVNALGSCLHETNDKGDLDLLIAAAAARALGAIASPEALSLLKNNVIRGPSEPRLQSDLLKAILACAGTLAENGSARDASSAFDFVLKHTDADPLRSAAFAGMLNLSSPRGQVRLIKQSLLQGPSYAIAPSLQFVSRQTTKNASQTKAFADLLPLLNRELQLALIENLAQRNDPAALPAIRKLARATDSQIRTASLRALGLLNDTSALPMLGQAAAVSTGEEQLAARNALLALRCTDKPFAHALRSKDKDVLLEIARAAGERGDSGLVDPLLKTAAATDPDVRKACLRAVAKLATAADIARLTDRVLNAATDEERTQAAEVLKATCQRLIVENRSFDPMLLAEGFDKGNGRSQTELIPVLVCIKSEPTSARILKLARSTDPEIRNAAFAAMAESDDPRFLPEMMRVATTETDPRFRGIAFNAAVRMASEDLPLGDRLAALETLMKSATRPEQKRLILSALAQSPGPKAMQLALPLLESQDTRNEAALAVLAIAPSLEDKAALTSLEKVILTVDGPAKGKAELMTSNILSNATWVRTWQVSDAYSQPGKSCQALFDIPFPPETDPSSANWRPLPAILSQNGPVILDLLKLYPGDTKVAYARTWILAEQDQPATLEIGSDDGLKVWLNGKIVHANNTARPLQPGSDKCEVHLNKGLNQLLLKITQNNMGWEFCVRAVDPRGQPLKHVTFTSTPLSH